MVGTTRASRPGLHWVYISRHPADRHSIHDERRQPMARPWAWCLRPHDAHPRDYPRLGYYRQAAPSPVSRAAWRCCSERFRSSQKKCPGAGVPGQSLQQSASYRGHRFSSQPPRTKRFIALASYPVVTEGAHLHRKKQSTIGAGLPSVTFVTQGESKFA